MANWERDFSRGPALAVDLMLAWKEVKRSLKKGDAAFADASKHFRTVLNEVVALAPRRSGRSS